MSNTIRKPTSVLAPGLLVAFACAFVFGVGGASTRIMQSYHGLHHSAYVYQITHGLVPPTNPSSIEAPANFYWVWHAALALGVRVFDVSPFEMSLVSNALGLSGFLLGLWWALGFAIERPVLRLAACGLPFFILDPLGLLQFATRLSLVWIPAAVRGSDAADIGSFEHLISIARHHGALQMTDQSLAPLFPRLGWLDGFVLSDRAGHLINKFLNFNSFPLALGFYSVGQALLLRAPWRPVPRACAIGVVTAGMAMISPLPVMAFGMTMGVHLLVEGPRAWRDAAVRDVPDRDARMRETLAPAVGSAIGLASALPFVLPVASAYGGSFSALAPGSGLLRHAIALGWPLVPTLLFLPLGFWLRRDLSAPARICGWSVVSYAGVALAFVLPKEDPNEYKLVLLSAFPASLFLVASGQALSRRYAKSRGGAERSSRVATAVLAGMTALSVGIMALLYLASPWAASEPFVFEGRVTTLVSEADAKRRDLDLAYAWLRESTPVRAYVLSEPAAKDEDLLPVIAQRRVVSQRESPFTHAIAHQARLIEANRAVIESLAQCRLRERDLDLLRALPVDWEDELYALVERRAGSTCHGPIGSHAVREFANDSFAIYRLRDLRKPDANAHGTGAIAPDPSQGFSRSLEAVQESESDRNVVDVLDIADGPHVDGFRRDGDVIGQIEVDPGAASKFPVGVALGNGAVAVAMVDDRGRNSEARQRIGLQPACQRIHPRIDCSRNQFEILSFVWKEVVDPLELHFQ